MKDKDFRTMLDLKTQQNINKSMTNPLINQEDVAPFKGDESFISTHSVSSMNDRSLNKSLESMPFNEEKDLDLPNFSSTKYKPLGWRIFHSVTYFLYTTFLLGSTICIFLEKKEFNTILLISHIFLFASSFLQWFYYKRGCIGKANYNSGVKNNIDRSSKAVLLRSEEGWKYFFSLIGSGIFIYGNIAYFIFSEERGSEFWNINLIGSMIISLSQILKLEKILTDNKQYAVKNDISNCFIEIFLFFGSLFFGASYYLQIMYNFDNSFNKFEYILKFIGNGFIIFSGFCLIHRYFLSDYDDLNTTDLSNVTI